MVRSVMWCLIRNLTEKLNASYSPTTKRTYRYKRKPLRGYKPNSDNLDSDYQEVQTYKEYLDERKVGLERAIVTLTKVLDVTKENAIDIVRQWTQFGTLSKSTIMENKNILREVDIDKSTLKLNIYALADSTSNIKKKIDCIRDVNLDINSAICLFKLPVSSFVQFAMITKNDKQILPMYNNRIEYLSKQLQVDISYLCTKFSTHPFMFKIELTKIIKINDFLIGSGMESSYIAADLNVYNLSMEHITERINRAKKAEMKQLKPWVVRCPIMYIEIAEKQIRDRARLFKSCKTLEEYIAQFMNCDIKVVNSLICRNPRISTIDINKLTTMLGLMLSYGYQTEEILSSSRVFQCKPSRIQKRYEEWMRHNLHPPSLSVICLSKTTFEKQLKKQHKKQYKTDEFIK